MSLYFQSFCSICLHYLSYCAIHSDSRDQGLLLVFSPLISFVWYLTRVTHNAPEGSVVLKALVLWDLPLYLSGIRRMNAIYSHADLLKVLSLNSTMALDTYTSQLGHCNKQTDLLMHIK